MKLTRHHLRIAVSVFFGVLTVALCVLWVRSYQHIDIVFGRDAVFEFAIGSSNGLFVIMGSPDLRAATQIAKFTEWGGDDALAFPGPKDTVSHWAMSRHRFYGATILLVPIWLPLLPALLVFGVSWPLWSRHFSLRSLLIATTIVAVVLGLAVWAGR